MWFSIVRESINYLNEIREVKNSIADFKHDECGPSYPFGVRWVTHSPKNLEINRGDVPKTGHTLNWTNYVELY